MNDTNLLLNAVKDPSFLNVVKNHRNETLRSAQRMVEISETLRSAQRMMEISETLRIAQRMAT